jgi:hypothetical protein
LQTIERILQQQSLLQPKTGIETGFRQAQQGKELSIKGKHSSKFKLLEQLLKPVKQQEQMPDMEEQQKKKKKKSLHL